MARTSQRLQGKAAIITGAGNGMGFATVKLFLEEGAKVIAVDILEEDLKKWENTDGVIPTLADVTKQEDIDRMVDAAARNFGRLDIVCNIAGINDLGYPLEATDDERWDKVLNIDLKAPFRICRKAVPVNCFGQPEDIAKTCLFLCSDDALQINGAVIAVDGGMACC